MAKNEFKLTDAQRLAAIETGKSVAILAGAGSGKTAVIIERIKNIILSGNAGLSEIVAITFTEKAAGELIYRLTRDISPEFRPQLDQATVTTIHGFCTKILREDAAAIGINPNFIILEEQASNILNHRVISDTLKNLLKSGDANADRIVLEMDFVHAVGMLGYMIETRWVAKKRANAILNKPVKTTPDREELLELSFARCFRLVDEGIESEKRRIGALDFADLEILTLELLSKTAEIQKKYQNRIKHILIDEFQDTSDIQSDIVTKLFNPAKMKLCIVGDPGQSIYGFRGANPAGLQKMKERIEKSGGVVVTLADNFRSSPSVVGFVNNLFTTGRSEEKLSADSNTFLPLIANIANESEVGIARLEIDATDLSAEETREKEAANIAAYIQHLVADENYKYEDFAMLFRSFTDISIYERALNNFSIPYYRSGGRTFLSQPEIAGIIICLKALLDPGNNTIAYGLAKSSLIGLSDDECYKLFSGKKAPIFDTLCSQNDAEFLTELLQIRDITSVPELIRRISDKSKLYNVFESLNHSGQSTANIEKLIHIAESTVSQHNFELKEFISYLDDLNSRGIGISEPPVVSPRDNAVKLLTIHAAKGLEFKVVVLADLFRTGKNRTLPYVMDKNGTPGFKLRKDENPIAEREETDKFSEIGEIKETDNNLEKERLLYVALTRTMETLLVSIPKQQLKKGSWLSDISPFLDKMKQIDKFEIIHACPAKVFSPTNTTPIKTLRPLRRRILTVSQLESYDRCPHEYYLKYVMRAPAERVGVLSESMNANIIGDVVHKTVQISFKLKTPVSDKLILRACAEFGHLEPSAKDLSEIRRQLENYTKSEYHDLKLQEPEHEVPFVIQSGDTLVKGTIDCIYKVGNAYSIVDFKTDTVKSAKDLKVKREEYDLQILTYGIAAWKSLNTKIDEIALLFLSIGQAEKIKMDENKLSLGLQRITEISDSIYKANFDINGRKAPCIKCPYYHNNTCWLSKVANND